MACRLFGAKPLSKPILGYCQLDHEEQTSVKFLSKYKLSTHENASEYIVCGMATILSTQGHIRKQPPRRSVSTYEQEKPLGQRAKNVQDLLINPIKMNEQRNVWYKKK